MSRASAIPSFQNLRRTKPGIPIASLHLFPWRVSDEGGAMEEKKDRRPEGNRENRDEEMERDTQIRRDTQVRGSLGVPASGAQPDRSKDRDEAIPEFGRLDDEDRMSDR